MMTRAPRDAQSVQIGGRQVASVAEWVEGARLRTLPAAISPVFAGTGIAVFAGGADLLRAVLAGLVALALQVGVNYANDYSDGVRGTDEHRVGPQRLVGTSSAVEAAFSWRFSARFSSP